jgi:hypothetical protein
MEISYYESCMRQVKSFVSHFSAVEVVRRKCSRQGSRGRTRTLRRLGRAEHMAGWLQVEAATCNEWIPDQRYGNAYTTPDIISRDPSAQVLRIPKPMHRFFLFFLLGRFSVFVLLGRGKEGSDSFIPQ